MFTRIYLQRDALEVLRCNRGLLDRSPARDTPRERHEANFRVLHSFGHECGREMQNLQHVCRYAGGVQRAHKALARQRCLW
jgi:hypothetical protein